LTEAHRNHAGTGCPISALAGDLGRTDKRTRAVVTQIVRNAIELVATGTRAGNENDRAAATAHAVLTYCALVGAIGVARAVSDQQLSREILKTVATLLKNSARARSAVL
jgi:TetR/AcrR family transcriptional regulator, transcriptional repressor for nem operon